MKLPYKYLLEDRKIEFENSLSKSLFCEDAKNPIFPKLLVAIRNTMRETYEKMDANKKYSTALAEVSTSGTEVANSIERIDFGVYDRCTFRRQTEIDSKRSVYDLYRYESEKIMMMVNELRPYPKINPSVEIWFRLKGGKLEIARFQKVGPIQSGVGSFTVADFVYNLIEDKVQELDDNYKLEKGRKANVTNID